MKKRELRHEEFDGRSIPVLDFEAKLIHLDETERLNTNDTKFYRATIEFADVHGEIQKPLAIAFGKTVDDHGLTVGQDYLCKVSFLGPDEDGTQQTIFNISHLPFSSNNVAVDAFGISLEDSQVAATSKATQKAAAADSVIG